MEVYSGSIWNLYFLLDVCVVHLKKKLIFERETTYFESAELDAGLKLTNHEVVTNHEIMT